LYTVPAMSSKRPSDASTPPRVVIDHAADVLTFTLDNPGHGNEVTGAMLDDMLIELRKEATSPGARVLRIRARGNVFCTGRERAGLTLAAIRRESARLIKFKGALRSSPLISVAEVQGDALGFGFGLAIVCDFAPSLFCPISANTCSPASHFPLFSSVSPSTRIARNKLV